MARVSVRNMSGETVGELDMSVALSEAAANIPLMHQAVVAEEANARRGTHDTKTQSEVRGGGAKPFRQKGTGRARQGSSRSSLHRHGGVVFGPTPRSHAKALPKKMRRAALRSALSARLADGALVIVDEIKLERISTRDMVSFLDSVEAFGKALVVLDGMTEEIRKSSRNIPGVALRVSPGFSVRDVLDAEKIIMTREAVAKLEEVLAQ